MTMRIRSLLAFAVIGTAVAATFSASRRITRAKEKARGAAAIDSWENEGGSALPPVRDLTDSR